VALYLPEAEVVVVDCASTDGTLELARRRAGVTTVALDENVGFGRASNRGLQSVAAPVAALVNPDVELLDDSLLELAAQALQADHGERLLVPRVLNANGTLQDSVHPRPASAADLIRAVVPRAAVPGRAGVALAPWRAQQPRRVGWAVGCALVARTRTLRELGPFDESTFMYGEDLELGLHAAQRGIETWLWPAARVIHHRAHATMPEFGGEAFERLARGRHDAVRRRLGARRAALDDGAQVVTFASRLALKRALGRPAARERAQLAAITGLRRRAAG
jgi:N-acetylglucosaminyl-diphospho-decaprenol L-rhamnosyltransferase